MRSAAREHLILIAYALARMLLAFIFAALLTGAAVLMWRDVRFVAHTVNTWVDRASR